MGATEDRRVRGWYSEAACGGARVGAELNLELRS